VHTLHAAITYQDATPILSAYLAYLEYTALALCGIISRSHMNQESNMTQLTLEMPETAFATLHKSPAEFTRELRVAAAVKWYELEMLSQGRAAEIAGLTRAEFITALGQYKVSPFQYTAEEVLEDLANAS
jgi:predicted HTH domain antitoxin